MSKFPAWLIAWLLGCSQAAISAELDITVSDQHGQPLTNAVIELIAAEAKEQPAVATLSSIAQQGLTFVPFVSAVPAGSRIEFPNRDKTRHHIYSFSDAKTFEIELYVGKPKQPVLFDKPGVVVLGCNIHDYMQAYIYIGQSPLLQITDENGRARFSTLSNQAYQVKLWHPWQLKRFDSTSVAITGDQSLALSLDVEAKVLPAPPKRGFGKN